MRVSAATFFKKCGPPCKKFAHPCTRLQHIYMKHYNDHGSSRGRINESHTNSLILMTWYNTLRAGLYFISLDRLWSKYKQEVQFWRRWESPLKQTCTLNSVIYSSKPELKIAKKFKTRLSNPIRIRLSKIYKIKIHHKAENPLDLNPCPIPMSIFATSTHEKLHCAINFKFLKNFCLFVSNTKSMV